MVCDMVLTGLPGDEDAMSPRSLSWSASLAHSIFQSLQDGGDKFLPFLMPTNK
jgi:hypothetical protein